MPKRETRERGGWMRRSHRPGPEHLCRGGEREEVTSMAETSKAPMCAEWVEEEEPVEGARKGWPEGKDGEI